MTCNVYACVSKFWLNGPCNKVPQDKNEAAPRKNKPVFSVERCKKNSLTFDLPVHAMSEMPGWPVDTTAPLEADDECRDADGGQCAVNALQRHGYARQGRLGLCQCLMMMMMMAVVVMMIIMKVMELPLLLLLFLLSLLWSWFRAHSAHDDVSRLSFQLVSLAIWMCEESSQSINSIRYDNMIF